MHVALGGWFWNLPHTGSGQYLHHLVTHAPPGVRYTVFLPFPPKGKLPILKGVTFVSLPARRGAWGKLYWEQWQLPQVAYRLGAELLHVPYWGLPLQAPLPVVVTVHDLIPLLLPAYRRRLVVRLYTALVAAATRRAAFVIADSEATRRDVLCHLRVPPTRVDVVYLAAGRQFSPRAVTGESELWRRLREQGIEVGKYLLYLGGFDIRKNLATAFKAFKYLQAAVNAMGCEVQFVVAGRLPRGSPSTPDPRRLAQESGVLPFTHFIGFVSEEEKPALYRGARAFIFPSVYEGFGLPPLEAMACGVPVVVSRAASLPEVVGAGGILAAPYDAKSMGQALSRLFLQATYRRRMRKQALRQAARFSWQRSMQKILVIYKKVGYTAL